jgi:amidase
MKSVIDQKPWLKDPLAARKPWSEDEYQLVDHGNGKKLCFAILWDDGQTRPHPPVIRGLEETKKALLAAGHEVIDWKPLKHEEIYTTAGAIWSAAAAEDFRVTTAPSGEPVIASMDLSAENSDVVPPNGTPQFRPVPTGASAYELWQVHKRKRELRQEYLDYWNATVAVTGTGRPVDAIISPCAAYVAPPHGSNKYIFSISDLFVSYTDDGSLGALDILQFGISWTTWPSQFPQGCSLILCWTLLNPHTISMDP